MASPASAAPRAQAPATPVRPKPEAPAPPPLPHTRPAERTSDPNLAVPVGEFDGGGVAAPDPAKLRTAHAHATVKRDVAEALLQMRAPSDGRSDPTEIEGAAREGDETEIQPPSGNTADSKTATGGRLRKTAALRRKRGLAGDVRYVFTAVFGVRRARRELAELEQRQSVRHTSRRRHLVTLGRTAVSAEAFSHAALAAAREALTGVEDERSKHAGAIAAADAELDRVRRDRAAKLTEHGSLVASCESELADLARKLEPLEKEAASARRRADDLRSALERADRKISETEARKVSVKNGMDPAAIQAELASLRADRSSVQRDEPRIAAELDAVSPRLAAIEAARTELQNRRRELDAAEAEDKRRTAELLEAIGAKRKVVERAAGEAEASRDRVLFELGERLYVDRPAILGAQLSPIDTIDLELGETGRRIMELREILSNIDRAKLVRGGLVIALGSLALATAIAWLLYLAL
jgi:hypothetical protein